MRFDAFLLSSLSIITHFGIVGTQSRCKDIPNSLGMSDLVNFGCKLVRGVLTLKFKNICEGEPCPGLGTSSNSICANGSCIDRSVRLGPRIPQTRPATGTRSPAAGDRPKPTVRRKPVRGAGILDVAVLRGQLQDTDGIFNSAPDSYITVCMHSGSKRESISSPHSEKDNCYCRTRKLEDNNNPYWEHNCDAIDVNKSNLSSTVLTFEAYDEEFITSDDFIGGNDITVEDIVKSGNNGKEFDIELFGPYSGFITVNITWTQIKRK